MGKQKSAPPATTGPAGSVAENGVALYGRWVPAKVEGLSGIRHTLDLETERGKAALVAAGSPGELALDETARLNMTLCDFACFWDTDVDEETGEIKEFVRSVFYAPDGRTFRTTSNHAPHFFARCVDVYGIERVKAGLPITICERVSRREKRRYHDFKVATDQV